MITKFNTTDFFLDKRLAVIEERFKKACEIKLKQISTQSENYMKSNRPWTDRTGDAKRELYSTVKNEGGGLFKFILGHGVPYGTYLEYRNNGQFEILAPTQRLYTTIIDKELTELALTVLKSIRN